ncbi:heavy-metal-associated domain-containing protein [Marinobacterium sedimentorum]|uniref:heavy-metal-associated domain-containing protein n=1 Tax=Marinobacterium sedimentorum TaxID=2927804 RepID=UPI0020C60449|nr:cation transporter [Marinobacterium sedimentorum]MCP8688601.1 cation transporter [Marinobacterium sedimentorum]
MTHEYKFNLVGVSCGGCIRTIETRFAASAEVESAEFDLPSKSVTVRTAASSDLIIDLIQDAGYNARLEA